MIESLEAANNLVDLHCCSGPPQPSSNFKYRTKTQIVAQNQGPAAGQNICIHTPECRRAPVLLLLQLVPMTTTSPPLLSTDSTKFFTNVAKK